MKEIKIYEIPSIDHMELVDDPYIGMIIYVSDIDTYYSVKTLKEINGINMKGSKVVEYVIDEYAAFGTGSGGGSGLTATQLSNIAKIPAIQSTVDALPNNYASKAHNHSEYASSSHRHDASEIDNLPSGGGTGLTSEQAQQLQTAYEHSQSTHVTSDDLLNIDATSLNGKKLSNLMTKDEYDAIDVKDPNTIYLVDDDTALEGIPSYSVSDAGKVLAINSTGTGLVWVTLSSSGGGSEEPKTLASISATYNQGSTTVYPSTNLDSLKSNLIVTATYSDNSTSIISSGYSLSGNLTVGTSTVTVTYSGKTTTFNVTVTETPAISEDVITDSIELWYQGNRASGNTLTDLSGKSRNLELQGNVTIENGAIVFDNSTYGIVEIPSTNILTLEWVAEYSEIPTAANRTAPVSTLAHTGSSGMVYYLKTSPIDAVEYGVSGSGRSSTQYTNNDPSFIPYTAGEGKKHFVMRYNESNSNFEIFINGSKTPRIYHASNVFNPSVTKIGIGLWSTLFTNEKLNNCKLYTVRAYSKMLTDEEILTNKNSSL